MKKSLSLRGEGAAKAAGEGRASPRPARRTTFSQREGHAGQAFSALNNGAIGTR